jgi:hypothetical protein
VAGDDVHEADVDEVHVLTVEESAELDRRLQSKARWWCAGATAPARVATRAVVKVRKHEPTMTAGKVICGIRRGRPRLGVVGEAGVGLHDGCLPAPDQGR